MSSLEHNNQFHFVKRLVKIIAPEYRVFSSENIEHDQCALDVKLKTIEIGEGTDIFKAVGAILFQAGHLRLRWDVRFKEHFGILENAKDETTLISKLSAQGALADKLALEWASTVFSSNWNITSLKAREFIHPYVWSEDEWTQFYLKN